MKPGARPAWERLTNAIEHKQPACLGDDRYTADAHELSIEDRAVMRAICAACPLIQLCTDYATIDKPAAGWWPGVQLKQKAAA